MLTPWGESDSQTTDAEGITFYTTPSHGGFHLSPERQAIMRAAYPGFTPFTGDWAWWEEDCDAKLVVATFGHIMDSVDQADIDHCKTFAKSYYNCWTMAGMRLP